MPTLQRGFLLVCVLLGACKVETPPPPSGPGTVEFFYNLLSDDGVGVTALDCTSAGVGALRFAVGRDLNRDGTLSTFEEIDSVVDPCNQADRDANGVFGLFEIGYFGPSEISAGSYDLFSVEVLDSARNPILWRKFDAQAPSDRFVFQEGIEVVSDVDVFVAFPGRDERMDVELEIFLPPPPAPPLPEE